MHAAGPGEALRLSPIVLPVEERRSDGPETVTSAELCVSARAGRCSEGSGRCPRAYSCFSSPSRSALGHPAPQPARLPGVVHGPDGKRRRLRSLDPVVRFIHSLCLPLLVPTDLQGFQASAVPRRNGHVAPAGGSWGLSAPAACCLGDFSSSPHH